MQIRAAIGSALVLTLSATEPARMAQSRPAPAAHVLITAPQASAVVVSFGHRLLQGSADRPLRADASGRLEIAPVESGAIVLIWAAGLAARQFKLPERPGVHQVDLPVSSPIRGQIVSVGERDDRDRVDQVWLDPEADDAPWPFFVQATVDRQGRFSIGGLAAGAYRVTSRPTGFAPVLAADVQGAVRFLSTEPDRNAAPRFRVLDHVLEADGREWLVRVAFGAASVGGYVQDEAGRGVSGAEVRAMTMPAEVVITASTARDGGFALDVPPTPQLSLTASHPAFGLQWTGGYAVGQPRWDGFRYGGVVPEGPVTLVLRRGVVLRGRVLTRDGQPFANEEMLIVPAYIGSGPASIRTTTDWDGRFAFERAVLSSFELVPRSLDHWNPHGQGQYFRITQTPELWIKAAAAGGSIDIQLESFVLLPVTLDVTAFGSPSVQVWGRSNDQSWGRAIEVDRTGRVQITMERGLEQELWVVPGTGVGMVPPWYKGVRSSWKGAPGAAMTLTVAP
jgi:hypothetical protein